MSQLLCRNFGRSEVIHLDAGNALYSMTSRRHIAIMKPSNAEFRSSFKSYMNQAANCLQWSLFQPLNRTPCLNSKALPNMKLTTVVSVIFRSVYNAFPTIRHVLTQCSLCVLGMYPRQLCSLIASRHLIKYRRFCH